MKLSCLLKFWRHDDGQDLIEYSLLIACLALATVGFFTGTRTETKDIWSTLNSALLNANTAAS